MDRRIVIGITAGVASLAGIAAGAAAVIACKKNFGKVFGEMQDDVSEQVFTSPDGNNTVTVSFGASKTAKGMALVGVTATSQDKTYTLLALARKADNLLTGTWTDNDHFQLLIGSCSNKQCCDVTFGGKKIRARYYLRRITNQ